MNSKYEASVRKQNIFLSLFAFIIITGLFYQGMYFLQQNMQKISWEK